MSQPTGRNSSASVRDRLLNLARSTGRDFQELVLRYTVERFLARLARSRHRDRFVLKGAMLYVAWRLDDRRTTMDLDMLGYGDPAPEQLRRVVREICAVELEDDGLAFDGESTQAAAMQLRRTINADFNEADMRASLRGRKAIQALKAAGEKPKAAGASKITPAEWASDLVAHYQQCEKIQNS